MTVFQCKMCGGSLHLTKGSAIAQCEYCGVRQTVPLLDDEKKAALFTRANQLLAECDFEKASVVYESIVKDYPQEPEAYWGLLLCEYGIEYVDDPKTGKKTPTCHRASYQSFLSEGDYQHVLAYADPAAAEIYRQEALRIEEIRKEILSLATREEPYDIFICYKETDENGERTIDSVLAQALYKDLTAEGYRVFFSRISLEQKLGVQYEPYIFAALQSAKVMLVVGTESAYFQSVWVKNEWSRFLKMMSEDRGKHLIPCYKNLHPSQMPREFAVLQGQDLGKIGAMQDILWGIQKLIGRGHSTSIPETSYATNAEVSQTRARAGTIGFIILFFFLAIMAVGMTGSSVEKSMLPIPAQYITELVVAHLIPPLFALMISRIVGKKGTLADTKAICRAIMILCILLGCVCLAILSNFETALKGTESNSLLHGLIPAVTMTVLYQLSKRIVYRVFGFPLPSKK